MDHLIKSFSRASFLSDFQPTVDRIVDGLVSLIKSSVTEINEDLLLRVADAVAAVVTAIVVGWLLWTMISVVGLLLWTMISAVGWLLWTMISAVGWLLWTMISLVVSLPWKVISSVVSLPWKVISSVVSLPRKVISGGVTLLWKVISPVVSLPWKVISGGVRSLWKVIMVIFGCGKGGKTMKAPGRNYRIFRNDFERNPANYFRNLRK